MEGQGRGGHLGSHIDVGTVQDIVHMLTCIAAQPPHCYPNMLEFLGDFLGENAQFEECRLAGVRAKSFRKWIRTSLTTKPGADADGLSPKGGSSQ
eukprot:7900303-Pyramimonas_sp.AAC.1